MTSNGLHVSPPSCDRIQSSGRSRSSASSVAGVRDRMASASSITKERRVRLVGAVMFASVRTAYLRGLPLTHFGTELLRGPAGDAAPSSAEPRRESHRAARDHAPPPSGVNNQLRSPETVVERLGGGSAGPRSTSPISRAKPRPDVPSESSVGL